MITKALAIIKPDAYRRGLTTMILKRLLDLGFEIKNITTTQLLLSDAESLYVQHKNKEFFKNLCEFMTSGPCVLIELRAYNCVQLLRKEIVELRRSYATTVTENVIHGSDSDEAAEYETRLFFKQ